jgi:hypothetical protein
MSCLSGIELKSFTKAVISFWFRLPQASVKAAKKSWTGEDGKLFDGIIPLVVIGKPGSGNSAQNWTTEQVQTGESSGGYEYTGATDTSSISVDPSGFCGGHGQYSYFCTVTHTKTAGTFTALPPVYSYTEMVVFSQGPAAPTNPTFIGVDCSIDPPVLLVNFQSNTKCTASGYAFQRTVAPGDNIQGEGLTPQAGEEGTVIITGCSIPFGVQIPFYDIESTGGFTPVYYPPGYSTGPPVVSNSDITDQTVDATGAIYSDKLSVTPDRWHHVLVSVDLSEVATHGGEVNGTIANIDSSSKLYVAMDDKNYTGSNLSSNWTGGGPNDVITDEARRIAGALPPVDDAGNPIATPTYSVKMSVPSGVLGIPAHATFVTNIYNVQMAEFLMWVGETLDTGVEKNRRLFIAPDKKGILKPVNPTPIYIPIAKTAVGDPATWEPGADSSAFVPPLSALDPSAAGSGNKLLGTPVIDFTKASLNWMMPRNLGTSRGKIAKIGKIKPYFPDPSI